MDWLNRCHFGDVRAVLRDMIAAGVQVNTIVTSPPYWGLRSYLPAGHPDKAFEIGSEPTIGEFIAGMVEVFDLARQVLRDDGTMWVNMGDSYAGSWGTQGREHSGIGVSALSARQVAAGQRKSSGTGSAERTPGLKPKDLIGQPWRLAFALQDAGWWLRQDIIWHKPNPMPESIRDRCTKAHEYIFLLSKSERYHYDFDAMQEPVNGTAHARRATLKHPAGWAQGDTPHTAMAHQTAEAHRKTNGVGWGYADGADAKPRTTRSADDPQPGTGRRVRKLAEAGCGTKLNESYDAAIGSGELTTTRNRRSVWTVPSEPYSGAHFATFPRKLIEPCILAGCPVGGTVLDIFFGSGTTGQVAQQLGRNFIGIDLNQANEPLQADRLRQPSLMLEAAA